jgi:hypothetical protein
MKSIPRIIEEQVQRWQIMQQEGREEKKGVSVITVSREPGSGGRIVATRLADKLGIAIFHQEVINEMAKSADVSEKLVETLDERGLSILEDWISSLVHERHLWPDRYMQHLMKVVGTIGKHGLRKPGELKMSPKNSICPQKMPKDGSCEPNRTAGRLSASILTLISPIPPIMIWSLIPQR